jgi:endogenous inhibitor of DNA gyrase (YacG/DUF329 family)
VATREECAPTPLYSVQSWWQVNASQNMEWFGNSEADQCRLPNPLPNNLIPTPLEGMPTALAFARGCAAVTRDNPDFKLADNPVPFLQLVSKAARYPVRQSCGGCAMKTCPICQKPASPQHKPFCSSRCSDVDLHKWLGEVYRVPVEEDEDEDGTPKPAVKEE